MIHYLRKSMVTCALISLSGVAAGDGLYTDTKDKACPKAWEDTTKELPVISENLEPWDTENTSDKTDALNHVAAYSLGETIDAVPVTDQDKLDDLLTVASACLVYRNLEVDTEGYVPTPPPTPNYDLGWLPASL